ncbi:MAG TPA: O-methyltransferase [Planctomycetota bacterium]|nr:O-methyltransferase [Planctomycetota bacterium]
MNLRSFEKFNYALRPAKNIERKMMCEAFGRLSTLASLRRYRYIGLGGLSFQDFALLHQRLGVHDMTSIEKEEDARERFLHNRPYSCIRVRWGSSSTVLPTLSWRKRTIVWLDYDYPLDDSVLADVRTVVAHLCSGSVLVTTVEADPKRVKSARNVAKARLDALRERVGEEKIPRGIRGADLRAWGLARVCREIIHNEIIETLAHRNAPLAGRWRIGYEQLFNFHYADGAQMVTVGGLFLNGADRARVPTDHFDDLGFVRSGNDPYHIEVPVLTWRETRYLDARLPGTAAVPHHPSWIPEGERRKYASLYRYFPTYLEAEL